MVLEFSQVDVLRDLDFPTYVTDLKFTPNVLVSAGGYKPCIKIHILSDHCLKNERNVENEVISIETISDDGLKLSLLRSDRYVDIHAKYGHHASFRLPCFAYDQIYNKSSAELIFLGSKGISVFNLEEGRFCENLCDKNCSSMKLSNTNALFCCSNENTVFFFDYRSKAPVAQINLENNVKTLDFHNNGINFVCGDQDSNVFLYDLRSKTYLYRYSCNNPLNLLRFNNDHICAGTNKGIVLYEIRSENGPLSELVFEDLQKFDFDGGLFAVFGSKSESISTYFCKGLAPASFWYNSLENDTSFKFFEN